jgi:hypothetical protein
VIRDHQPVPDGRAGGERDGLHSPSDHGLGKADGRFSVLGESPPVDRKGQNVGTTQAKPFELREVSAAVELYDHEP